MNFQRLFRLPNLKNGLLGRKLRQDYLEMTREMCDLAKGGAEGINRDRHFHPGSGDGGSPLLPPRADGQDLGRPCRHCNEVRWVGRCVGCPVGIESCAWNTGRSGHQTAGCPNAGSSVYWPGSHRQHVNPCGGRCELRMGGGSGGNTRPVKVRGGSVSTAQSVVKGLGEGMEGFSQSEGCRCQRPGAGEARSELKPGSRGEGGQLCRCGFKKLYSGGGLVSWRVGGNSAVIWVVSELDCVTEPRGLVGAILIQLS